MQCGGEAWSRVGRPHTIFASFVFYGFTEGIILTSQVPQVRIGSVTDMGTVTAILPTGVQLKYNGQTFVASFVTMEKLVKEGKVS